MKRDAAVLLLTAALSLPAATVLGRTRVEKHRAHPASIVEQSYNGPWAFEVTTTVGACPQVVSNILDIRENRVASVDQPGTASWGYVDSDGTFVARLTRQDGNVARIQGRLRGSAGAGTWSSSTDMCGGTWRANRSETEHAGR